MTEKEIKEKIGSKYAQLEESESKNDVNLRRRLRSDIYALKLDLKEMLKTK